MLIGEHQLLDGAVEKIGDYAIDRAAVALDQNSGLAGRDKLGIVAAARKSAASPRPRRPSCPRCNLARR